MSLRTNVMLLTAHQRWMNEDVKIPRAAICGNTLRTFTLHIRAEQNYEVIGEIKHQEEATLGGKKNPHKISSCLKKKTK